MRGKRSRPLNLFCSPWFVLALTILVNPAPAKVFDGGVDSNNLGKGEWIYVLNSLFGGQAPGVTDVGSMMAYCATNLHCQFVVVKSATGSTNFPSAASPQFTSALVSKAHAWGLKIFGYTRSYGADIPGEIAAADYVFNCGADGFILDAETEWESSAAVGSSSTVGTNGPALAMQLCGGIKTNWPNKFLAHSPFAVISYHSTFPYQQFGFWCDAAMPQDYWVDFGMTPTATVQWMDGNWRSWQNGLAGVWTNAIKPVVPIGQADNTNQPGTDITEFVNYLQIDPACVTANGYNGCIFFRPGLQTPVMLKAIAGSVIGSNNQPYVTTQPQGGTVLVGQDLTVAVAAKGAVPLVYQWLKNAQTISGATNPACVFTNVQTADSGNYSVLVSNSFGSVTSAIAMLVVQTNLTAPAPIIIDNTNSNFSTSGSWVLGSSSADKYGSSYNYASTVTGAATATATFVPAIVSAGNYDVYIWYPQGGNRTTNAAWSVVGGSTVNINVNQQVNGGQWYPIASNITFPAGNSGYIRVANNGGPTVVMADAVEVAYSPIQLPVIIHQPQSQVAYTGSSVTFSVQAVAYGTNGFSYQWKCNSANISGATNSSYTINNVHTNNAGSFSVSVRDSAGSADSSPAVLTVQPAAVYFYSISVMTNGQIHLLLGGDPVPVVLQASTNLTDWLPIGTGSLTNGPLDFFDNITNGARFYRLGLGP